MLNKFYITIACLLISSISSWNNTNYSYLNSGTNTQEESFAIINVRIFDGKQIYQRGAVIIESGVIKAVGDELEIPVGTEVVDGNGHTLLPGLIDSHTHVFDYSHLKQALIFGVTTELDMFMSHTLASTIKKQISSGERNDLADLFTAGTLVNAPGGHGTQFGLKIPTITSPAEAPAFVDARIAEGSDYIKLVYDTISPAHPMPTLSKEVMEAVIKAAHEREKLAVVHITKLADALDAVEAGADGLVHLFADGKRNQNFGRIVAQNRVFVIPTLTVVESLVGIKSGASLVDDPDLGPYISPANINSLDNSFIVPNDRKHFYASAKEAIQQLKDANVPILAGTDAPNPGTAHGISIHRELELLVEAGLSPVEALRSATSIPAETFNLGKRGMIAPGFRADLLLVKGDPTTEIKNTRTIVNVWKLGRPVDRTGYLEAVEKERELEEARRSEPPPPGSESGLISNFDGEKIVAEFGMGWIVSTDSFTGGKSVAEMRLIEGGYDDSGASLLISGEIKAGAAFPWAGALFSPGKTVFDPVNLSSKKDISFWARGEGELCILSIFATKFGFTPVSLTFRAEREWKQFIFPLSRFNGFDGSGLTGIFFGGNPVPGKFSFQIDEVKLK